MILLQAFPAASPTSSVVFSQRFSFPTGTGQMAEPRHRHAVRPAVLSSAPEARPRPMTMISHSHHAASAPPSAPPGSSGELPHPTFLHPDHLACPPGSCLHSPARPLAIQLIPSCCWSPRNLSDLGGAADRLLASCTPGMEAAAAEREEDEGLELSLSLHTSPSSPPPRFQAVFACCYCPRKFRSSQALGGHQNAHKLQRNLARWRGREAASAPPAPPTPPVADEGIGSRASGSESAPTPRSRPEPAGADAWGDGRHHHRRQHHLYQRPAPPASAEASSGASSRGGGEAAEESIDLSLRL